MPLLHTPLAQSPDDRHIEPSAHFLLSDATQLPPQSRSVSVPFFFPSPQFGAWHTRPVQTWLSQSTELTHAPPVGQPEH
jgi:hypothetical protein